MRLHAIFYVFHCFWWCLCCGAHFFHIIWKYKYFDCHWHMNSFPSEFKYAVYKIQRKKMSCVQTMHKEIKPFTKATNVDRIHTHECVLVERIHTKEFVNKTKNTNKHRSTKITHSQNNQSLTIIYTFHYILILEFQVEMEIEVLDSSFNEQTHSNSKLELSIFVSI